MPLFNFQSLKIEELSSLFNNLHNEKSISDLEYRDFSFIMSNPYNLKNLPKKRQTKNLCWVALRLDSRCIEYIEEANRTQEMVNYAINDNHSNLCYCPSLQDSDVCFNAVKKKWSLLRFVKNQTREMIISAINQDGMALELANFQDDELCLMAVKNNGLAIKYVKNQTTEIIEAAFKNDKNSFEYIKFQTEDMAKKAVEYNSYLLKYVKNQTQEICLAAVKKNGMSLSQVKVQTPEICLAAVTEEGQSIIHVEDQTEELCLLAIDDAPEAIDGIKNKTKKIKLAALKKWPRKIIDDFGFFDDDVLFIMCDKIKSESIAPVSFAIWFSAKMDSLFSKKLEDHSEFLKIIKNKILEDSSYSLKLCRNLDEELVKIFNDIDLDYLKNIKNNNNEIFNNNITLSSAYEKIILNNNLNLKDLNINHGKPRKI